MIKLTNYIIPIFVLVTIIYAYKNKVDIYEAFINGAVDGIKLMYEIIPTIVAMVFAINVFSNSNIFEYLLLPFRSLINVPKELLSLALLRPISGTSTLALMNNIFIKYGADSKYGLMASVIQGCTDTTVYVMALYYGSIKVKNIRYNLIVGLIADFFGILLAIILTNIFFRSMV